MPRTDLILPGQKRQTPIATIDDVAGRYSITITREDGIACTDVEAATVMSLWQCLRVKTSKEAQVLRDAFCPKS